MIHVKRSRHIEASPEQIFAALADPSQLSNLLPRVQHIEFLDQGSDYAHVATHMALGPLGSIRTEGNVKWQTNREVVFRTSQPVSVESRWTLTPTERGTNVSTALSLDLAPLFGPLATFIPLEQVSRMIAPDLDSALTAIARRFEPAAAPHK